MRLNSAPPPSRRQVGTGPALLPGPQGACDPRVTHAVRAPVLRVLRGCPGKPAGPRCGGSGPPPGAHRQLPARAPLRVTGAAQEACRSFLRRAPDTRGRAGPSRPRSVCRGAGPAVGARGPSRSSTPTDTRGTPETSPATNRAGPAERGIPVGTSRA